MGLNEGALNDVLLAGGSAEERLGEAGSGVSHGEGGGASALLGLDDLITTEGDAVAEALDLLIGEVGALDVGEEGEDGDTGVATNDGHVDLVHGEAELVANEAVGAHNIEGGDTHDLALVVDTVGLEGLGHDGDGGVDRVRDDKHEGVGAGLGDGLTDALHNAGVGVEEVIAAHTGLAGHTGRDHDGVTAGEEVLHGLRAITTGDLALSVDVAEVSADTLGAVLCS